MSSNVIEGKIVNNSWIYSMANRRKVQTGLPVNIWIDEKKAYVDGGHWKRIKFQLNHGDKTFHQPDACMDLEGNVVASTFNESDSELNSKDIKAVSNFVKNNSYALDKVADEDIYMDQFDEVMIKGGEPASHEQIENQRILVDKFIEENE